MNWRIKGLIQNTLSAVPGGVYVNTKLQRLVGNLRNFEANIDKKVVGDWLVLLSHMRELKIDPAGMDYLEVGTGWYPTLPICYSLVGARSCRTYDVQRHMSEALTFRMLARLEAHLPEIAAAGNRELSEVQASYATLRRCRTLGELLDSGRIEYVAPGDASKTGLPARSVNVVFSNSVLEHVPAETIKAIMKESFRVLCPGGLAIHSANCGDHYAYFDRGITQINYLSFSEEDWKRWNNSLLFQNRLRPQDFLAMAEDAGLSIRLAKHEPNPKLLAALAGMKIAAEFKKYSPEQLAATSIDFVAQRSVLEEHIQVRGSKSPKIDRAAF